MKKPHEVLHDWDKFLSILDERLLDLATGAGTITTDEYQHWVETRNLYYLATRKSVKEALAASMDDVGYAFKGMETGTRFGINERLAAVVFLGL